MEEKKTNSQLVGVNVIAQLFGLTERRVQQLTQAGVLAATKDGRYNKYDILKTVQRYIAYLQGKAAEKEEGRDIETERRASEAEASLKESKAGMAAMELRELESKMHRSEDVEAMTTDLILIITQRLNELPDRLAGIHKTGSAAEASSAIQKEAHAILWDLSRYQFDPEEYEKRKAAIEEQNKPETGNTATERRRRGK